jgi:hypothetical protein
VKRFALLIALVALLAIGVGTVVAGRDRLSPELRSVATSLARFHSVGQATAAGYAAASPCEQSPDGAMGIHYANGPLVGDPRVDPLHPEVLLYLPDKSGDQRLVGIEYMVIDADQNLATDNDRPSVFGHPFNGPMPGHTPGMPIHYDLHVWLYESNPTGLFSPWNPAIHCP